jgi:alpha/beta superfamily hydrolase
MPNISKQLFITGKAGRLESIFNPKDEPTFLAVVCHPHPLHEGTMHNKVVFNTAKTLGECGAAVVRFNFRGVMASEGVYDKGHGEQDDVRSALDFIVSEYPDVKKICVAGFSFGAWVGLNVGVTDARVQTLIGLGLPVQMFDAAYLEAAVKSKLLIYGDQDEYNPMPILVSALQKVAEPSEIHILPDADHFFTGRIADVNALVKSFIAREVL